MYEQKHFPFTPDFRGLWDRKEQKQEQGIDHTASYNESLTQLIMWQDCQSVEELMLVCFPSNRRMKALGLVRTAET
jgi:hypothetical protein